MAYVIGYLVVGIICGFISSAIATNREMQGGFAWGFFLGIIGIIIVAVRPKDSAVSTRGTKLYYCKNCNGIYTGRNLTVCPECNLPVAETQFYYSDWQGITDEKKSELKKAIAEGQYLVNVKDTPTTSTTTCQADEIKKYKELADAGVITQEEFEAKKKQLLGL